MLCAVGKSVSAGHHVLAYVTDGTVDHGTVVRHVTAWNGELNTQFLSAPLLAVHLQSDRPGTLLNRSAFVKLKTDRHGACTRPLKHVPLYNIPRLLQSRYCCFLVRKTGTCQALYFGPPRMGIRGPVPQAEQLPVRPGKFVGCSLAIALLDLGMYIKYATDYNEVG